ncbi:MAG: hypothetical protein II777_02580 [Clostridia bacterium]|nr:hypothetical protein [Clostridia bacterium]
MKSAVKDLRVCLLKEPFGVLPSDVRFSFRPVSDKNEAKQSAYRIGISKGINNIKAGVYEFDTGFISSSSCTGIKADGAELKPGTLYYYAVTVRFDDGTEAFSEPSFFATAPGDIKNARAIRCKNDPHFAYFRRDLGKIEAFDKVCLTVCASSPEPARQFVCAVSVNGAELGVTSSRLGRTPDKKTVLYFNSFDITRLVKDRGGEVTALCRTDEDKTFYCSVYGFRDDGTLCPITDTSDGKWLSYNADKTFRPDNSIGTHYYKAYASNVDAAYLPEKNPKLWEKPDDAGYIFEKYVPLPSYTPPVRRRRIEAKKVTKLENGYLIDIGRETVGGIEAAFDSFERTEIEAFYGEEQNADGSVKYRMNTGNVYYEKFALCTGVNTVKTPDLMTFRYVFFKGEAKLLSVYGLQTAADLDNGESSFYSDNALLNDIYALTKRSVEATSQDLYVDSQSRERGAYEGDMLINMLSSYCFYGEYAIPRFSAEYIYTHRTWPAEYILLTPAAAYADYMYTGDTGSLEKYYAILKNNDFSRYEGEYGLIHSGNSGSQGENAVLTDWPPSERDGYDTAAKYNTVLNCVAAYSYEAVSLCAAALGLREDEKEYGEKSAKLKKAVMKYLYDKEKGAFCDGLYEDGKRSGHFSQHASAYALFCGVCTKTAAKKAADFIKKQGKIKTSVYGAFFLLAGLYENGFGGTANELLLDNDVSEGARTWAYMIHKLGATLTAEAWNAKNKPNMTFSHPWATAPAYCITAGIFGIKPLSPGFERFSVKFQRKGLRRAGISVPTVRGTVSASFEGNTYTVTVPTGCTALVSIRAVRGKRLYRNGALCADPVNGDHVSECGSGTHEFRFGL